MEDIPKIKFNKKQEVGIGFEIITLPGLGSGSADSEMGHDPRKPHRLSFYVIVFVKDERAGTHLIDFEEYAYRQGDIIFISREQVHAFRDLNNKDAYMLLFTDEFLSKNIQHSDRRSFDQIYNYHIYHPVVSAPQEGFKELNAIIETIHTEFLKPFDFAKEEILRSLLKVFLLKSGRIRMEVYDYENSPYYKEFILFQNLLTKYLSESRNVKYYADLMHISTKKLNMITTEFVKQPAKSYIDSILMLEIKRMLVNSTESVKEIGYINGFDEPTNFVKFFKKFAQMTPATFRKMNQ